MKKFLIIFSIIIFLLLSTFLVLSSPFVIYWAIINNKYEFKFFNRGIAQRTDRLLLPGKLVKDKTIHREDSFEDKYWKNFHVTNFKIPLPLFHPLLIVSPIINEEEYKSYVQMGVRFHTQTQKVITEIYLNEGNKFRKYLDSQKIFTIPLVKSFLERKDIQHLWRDLFLKDLRGISFWKVWKTSPMDLLYNLYVLHLRMKFFPEETKTYYFYERSKLGGVVLDSKIWDMRKETNYFLVDGIVESYTLITSTEVKVVSAIRRRLIQQIFFAPSFIDETKVLYDQFRVLSYKNKIGVEGMIYLFAAWSHNPQDKEFLREIIGHLEKGEGHLNQLQPLYVYAFKHYGEQFSGQRKLMNELEGKIKDEDKRDRRKNEGGSSSSIESDFTDKEEKMKYFLQKAKEKAAKKERTETLIYD